MNAPVNLFHRAQLRQRRARVAAELFSHYFLLNEAVNRIGERLQEMQRCFPLTLAVGSHRGILSNAIEQSGKAEAVVEMDLSPAMLLGSRALCLAADEEWLPFAPESFDAILSVFSLHWVNDLPGALLQMRQALKPDGLLLASFPGGETLTELRQSLALAEMEITGGMSPRVSPFLEVREAGALLQRAGFALPVADVETVQVTYPDAFALMRDLRGMGESNTLVAQEHKFTRRAVFIRTAELYQERFGMKDGRIPARFDIITLTAWKPHETQQQPAKRGSGKVSLAEILGKDSAL